MSMGCMVPMHGCTQCFGTNAYVTHDGMVSMHVKLHMTWHNACNTMGYNAVINVARYSDCNNYVFSVATPCKWTLGTLPHMIT